MSCVYPGTRCGGGVEVTDAQKLQHPTYTYSFFFFFSHLEKKKKQLTHTLNAHSPCSPPDCQKAQVDHRDTETLSPAGCQEQ